MRKAFLLLFWGKMTENTGWRILIIKEMELLSETTAKSASLMGVRKIPVQEGHRKALECSVDLNENSL